MREPVVVYSSWSYATLVTSISSQHLSEWFKENGFNPIEVIGTSANRIRIKRVMNYIQKDVASQGEPPLIIYMGHGFPDSWVGFEPLALRHPRLRMVRKDVNDDLFKDCIVHTIACYSIRELGPSMVSKGAKAYFGSSVPMLVGDFERDRDYIKDFVDIFTIIPKLLARGYSCGDAYNEYIARCSYYITHYKNHPELVNVAFYTDAMLKNRDMYKLLGDQSARYNREELTCRYSA